MWVCVRAGRRVTPPTSHGIDGLHKPEEEPQRMLCATYTRFEAPIAGFVGEHNLPPTHNRAEPVASTAVNSVRAVVAARATTTHVPTRMHIHRAYFMVFIVLIMYAWLGICALLAQTQRQPSDESNTTLGQRSRGTTAQPNLHDGPTSQTQLNRLPMSHPPRETLHLCSTRSVLRPGAHVTHSVSGG